MERPALPGTKERGVFCIIPSRLSPESLPEELLLVKTAGPPNKS